MRVTWVVEVDAEDAYAAAEKARALQLWPRSAAAIFEVDGKRILSTCRGWRDPGVITWRQDGDAAWHRYTVNSAVGPESLVSPGASDGPRIGDGRRS